MQQDPQNSQSHYVKLCQCSYKNQHNSKSVQIFCLQEDCSLNRLVCQKCFIDKHSKIGHKNYFPLRSPNQMKDQQQQNLKEQKIYQFNKIQNQINDKWRQFTFYFSNQIQKLQQKAREFSQILQEQLNQQKRIYKIVKKLKHQQQLNPQDVQESFQKLKSISQRKKHTDQQIIQKMSQKKTELFKKLDFIGNQFNNIFSIFTEDNFYQQSLNEQNNQPNSQDSSQNQQKQRRSFLKRRKNKRQIMHKINKNNLTDKNKRNRINTRSSQRIQKMNKIFNLFKNNKDIPQSEIISISSDGSKYRQYEKQEESINKYLLKQQIIYSNQIEEKKNQLKKQETQNSQFQMYFKNPSSLTKISTQLNHKIQQLILQSENKNMQNYKKQEKNKLKQIKISLVLEYDSSQLNLSKQKKIGKFPIFNIQKLQILSYQRWDQSMYPFLLNYKNLKTFSVPGCKQYSDSFIENLIQNNPSLQQFNPIIPNLKTRILQFMESRQFKSIFPKSNISYSLCQKMCKNLKKLKSLHLSQCQDKLFPKLFFQISCLQYLNLGSFQKDQVLAQGIFQSLGNLSFLKSVSLINLKLKSYIFRHQLNQKPQKRFFYFYKWAENSKLSLKTVYFHNYQQLVDDYFPFFAQLPFLQNLIIEKASIEGINIHLLQNLKTLVFKQCPYISTKTVTQSGIDKFKKLQIFSCDLKFYYQQKKQFMDIFQNLVNIKYLCLGINQLTDNRLKKLKNLKNLQTLVIKRNHLITKSGLQWVISNFQKLKKLGIAYLLKKSLNNQDNRNQRFINKMQLQELSEKLTNITHLNLTLQSNQDNQYFNYEKDPSLQSLLNFRIVKNLKSLKFIKYNRTFIDQNALQKLKQKGVYTQISTSTIQISKLNNQKN